MKNQIELTFSALTQNETFARAVIASFAAQMNPSIEQLSDLRTAVSEAVTNAIIHGYERDGTNYVKMRCTIDGDLLARRRLRHRGCGAGTQAVLHL